MSVFQAPLFEIRPIPNDDDGAVIKTGITVGFVAGLNRETQLSERTYKLYGTSVIGVENPRNLNGREERLLATVNEIGNGIGNFGVTLRN